MTKEKSPARQGPRYIFYFLMLAILGWFIFMQFFGADERTVTGNSPSLLYPGTFTWEKSDGTTEEITVPGSYNVPAGETMVITSTLPADFDASSIAIRSSLQDINIYIDGTLREQYSTSKTRLIGKNSASRFIFCSTSHEDAGKELRIELTTILFSLTLGFVYHTSFDMEYLGWCMIMGATWMLGESKIRQLLIPNPGFLVLRYDSPWTDSPSALCRQCTARTSPQTLSYCNRNLPAEFYSLLYSSHSKYCRLH